MKNMIRFGLATALATAMTTTVALAQTTPLDSAHTLVTSAAPDFGRAGQVVQLPQGGVGVTTGGTAYYQTLTTPSGSAVMFPGGGGAYNVIGAGGRGGIAHTAR